MSATKWVTQLEDLITWSKLEKEVFGEWFSDGIENNIIFQNQLPDQSGINGGSSGTDSTSSIPSEVAILPLRGLVVYPQTAIPLTIGQPRSIRLIDEVANGERLIGLLTSRDPDLENPDPENLYTIGTIGMIHRLFRAPDGTIRLLVQGMYRIRVTQFIGSDPYIKAAIEPTPEIEETGLEVEALARNVREQFTHIADLIPSIPRELVASVTSIENPLQTAYTVANFQRMEIADAQNILEINSTAEKLHKLVTILTRESEVLELGQKIQNEARSEIEKVQRDYFLREQLKAIQKELGEKDEQTADIEEFRKKIETAQMPPESDKQARSELDRLSRLPTSSPEYSVIRTYLDTLVSLPWSISTDDNLDIAHARQVLDHDHFGLIDVKKRILEFLAVRKLRFERRAELAEQQVDDDIRKIREGIILCFVGPPGVGKTSLGQSIAHALGRKFIRVSLGGVHDEAEIRGHRRTYIGALPGRIVQAIRRIESNNPIFMLDEVDKVGNDFRGDPTSALLEVLDPEQNSEFRDHYLEVPFNLSQVMFITTANQLETIPLPLLDRMEVISIAGYTEREKVAIAKNYLIPRQLRENGLMQNELSFNDDAILTIIRLYTREAGVRNLERMIGSVCRKIVTEFAEEIPSTIKITPESVRKHLGRQQFLPTEEISQRTAVPGVATGLAWTPVGGEILFIEATSMPGRGGFQITGSIGKVMQESAQAALSFVRSKVKELNLDPNFFDENDIHLHVPAGAQPKDGPSAGVTIVTALVSLISGKPVRHEVAMTGEITLLGQVLPIGGLKEKALAAHQAGVKVVFMPKRNEPDLDELPSDVKNSVEFIGVENIEEILKIAFSNHKKSKKDHKKGR